MEEECMDLINQLYETIEPNMGKLVHLELATDDYCRQVDFMIQMKNLHQEIRNASTNRFRYFVNMKLSKLKKDIKSPVPLSEYLGMLDNDTNHQYWKIVHQLYVLLESELDDKNEPYINTIVDEITRRDKVVADELLCAENAKKTAIERAEKRLTIKQENANMMPDVDDFLKQLDENPEMMDAITAMTGQKMSTKDMKKSLKQAMSENPQMVNMLQNAMNSDSGEMDIMGMVEQFIPNLDMNCHTNIVLVNKIYADLMYIFEGDAVKDRMKEKIRTYRDLITRERISVNEMLACLWKISNDEEKFTAIKNINTDELGVETLMSVAMEFIPPEMLEQFGDIEAMKKMFAGGGDMGPLADVMKMFKKDMKPEIEEELTEDQLKELEDYYNEII